MKSSILWSVKVPVFLKINLLCARVKYPLRLQMITAKTTTTPTPAADAPICIEGTLINNNLYLVLEK